jgi:SAM-dependent methyltransferase
MSLISSIHHRYIFGRRIRRLCDALVVAIPHGARVLDVGAGDGSLDRLLTQHRPDITINGVDVLVRPETAIPVKQFDGLHLPYADKSWDVAMFVDVLHHTNHQRELLKEALRVANVIVIKDHLDDGLLSNRTLRFMDHVGNADYGVALPYDYWSTRQWTETFEELRLEPSQWQSKLHLYPFPLNLWFDRSLHFVATLEPTAQPVKSGPVAGYAV